jgi:hypothetical protein
MNEGHDDKNSEGDEAEDDKRAGTHDSGTLHLPLPISRIRKSLWLQANITTCNDHTFHQAFSHHGTGRLQYTNGRLIRSCEWISVVIHDKEGEWGTPLACHTLYEGGER